MAAVRRLRHSAAFLDIETTGLSPYSSYLTLVGVLDQDGYHGFVRDDNLTDLREALERYDLVVTFNGASFDLPYVEHSFGSVFAHVAHLDLMYPLRRLGYGGGLKRIEAVLGVGRPSELSGLSGYDAVRLWRMWTRGAPALSKRWCATTPRTSRRCPRWPTSCTTSWPKSSGRGSPGSSRRRATTSTCHTTPG